MPYNLSTLENGCKELGIELSQKQKDQFIQFFYIVKYACFFIFSHVHVH